MVEYRGYGNSSGEPSEKGLMLDAQATMKYLCNPTSVQTIPNLISDTRTKNSASTPSACLTIDKSKIFLIGRSLGGAVAIRLAAEFPQNIAGVIVENTFISIEEMVIVIVSKMGVHSSTAHRILRVFLNIFMTSHWKSIEHIRKISAPLLVISGLADELVPPSHPLALYEAAQSSKSKKLYTVANGEHNDTFLKGGPAYYETIRSFLYQESN
jgi:fermentation-respiration switch protein FrsA (DUF1100 family)